MPPIAQPWEMTIQEARDRVTLAYGLLVKARRQVEGYVETHRRLTGRIEDTRKVYSLYRTFDLLDRHRDAPFNDFLTPIYRPGEIEGARARITEAFDRIGIRPTLTTLREEPERFGELLGEAASTQRAHTFEAATRLGQELEDLLLERTPQRLSLMDDYLHLDDIDISDARSLPDAISQLDQIRQVTEDFMAGAVEREVSAERYLAEAARLTGGDYFAHTHLGNQVGFTVSVALQEHPELKAAEPTHFSQLQGQLDAVDRLAGHIAFFQSGRRELLSEISRLSSQLRDEQALIDRRTHWLEALRRDRKAFQSHVAEAFRNDSLRATQHALKVHTRARGRAATAEQLKQQPARFGRLRGLPRTPTRHQAMLAAREAGARLQTFETHRARLAALPTRRSISHFQRLEAGLAQAQRRLEHIPSLRGYQVELTRALEAAGGLRRVASYLSAKSLSHIDQALQVARSLGGGRER